MKLVWLSGQSCNLDHLVRFEPLIEAGRGVMAYRLYFSDGHVALIDDWVEMRAIVGIVRKYTADGYPYGEPDGWDGRPPIQGVDEEGPVSD